MAIVELPGGGGTYDDVTGEIKSYDPQQSAKYAPGGVAITMPENFYGDGDLVPTAGVNVPIPIPVPDPFTQPGYVAPGFFGSGDMVLDPGRFGMGVTGGSVAGVGGALVAGSIIKLSSIAGRLGLGGARQVAAAAAGAGSRMVSTLPGPVRAVLAVLGIGAGTQLVFDWIDVGDGDSGLQLNGVGGIGTTVIGRWEANGVQFFRLSDGRLGAVKKDGRVKLWRPKKPIVLFSGGAGNLRTFLKADAALDRQSKKLRKVLTRRAPGARRSKQQMHYPPHDGGVSVTNVK